METVEVYRIIIMHAMGMWALLSVRKEKVISCSTKSNIEVFPLYLLGRYIRLRCTQMNEE